jgi:group I intron endonuclease
VIKITRGLITHERESAQNTLPILSGRTMPLYIVTNKVNGTTYVGKTILKVQRRWSKHVRDARNGSQTHFHRAIRKYGADNFTLRILPSSEGAPDSQLQTYEISLIALLEKGGCKLYNQTHGGDGTAGLIRTDEHCHRISESLLGNKHPFYGKHLSEEHRRKIGEAGKGRVFSSEARRKIGIPHRKPSEEQVAEMRALYDSGEMGCRRLGREFDLSKSTVWAIVTRQTYVIAYS